VWLCSHPQVLSLKAGITHCLKTPS
jgi:hypothetical protein